MMIRWYPWPLSQPSTWDGSDRVSIMNPSFLSRVWMNVQTEGSSSRIRMRISPAAWKSANPADGETRTAWRFTSAGGGGGRKGILQSLPESGRLPGAGPPPPPGGERPRSCSPRPRPPPGRGVHLDPAAVRVQHSVNHREAEPAVAELRGKERLNKHPPPGLVRQPGPRVGDPHLDVRPGRWAAEKPRQVGRGELHQ